VQDVEVLALVLVDALDLHVEHRVGVETDAGALGGRSASRALLARLTARHSARNAGVVGQRLELAQPSRSRHPAVADRAR
jgi:hypothetical protein